LQIAYCGLNDEDAGCLLAVQSSIPIPQSAIFRASGGGDDVRSSALCRRQCRKCPMKIDESQPSAAPSPNPPTQPAPRRPRDLWRVLKISFYVLVVLAAVWFLLHVPKC
jgi:hypothetical protein